MGGAFILMKFAAFAVVENEGLLAAFSDTQRIDLMGFFSHLYGNAVFFLLVPMAFGGALFFALFFRARFIPRWLAAWGVVTYVVIGCLATTIITVPSVQEHAMLFFLPGALFELVVALWLLFVGIDTRHWEVSHEEDEIAA